VHRLSRQTYKTDKSRYGATILCGNPVPEVSSDSKLSQPIHDGLIDFDVLPRFSNVRALPARARGVCVLRRAAADPLQGWRVRRPQPPIADNYSARYVWGPTMLGGHLTGSPLLFLLFFDSSRGTSLRKVVRSARMQPYAGN
jgi:hypothetical protein